MLQRHFEKKKKIPNIDLRTDPSIAEFPQNLERLFETLTATINFTRWKERREEKLSET